MLCVAVLIGADKRSDVVLNNYRSRHGLKVHTAHISTPGRAVAGRGTKPTHRARVMALVNMIFRWAPIARARGAIISKLLDLPVVTSANTPFADVFPPKREMRTKLVRPVAGVIARVPNSKFFFLNLIKFAFFGFYCSG
jgi:hypothetical protein